MLVGDIDDTIHLHFAKPTHVLTCPYTCSHLSIVVFLFLTFILPAAIPNLVFVSYSFLIPNFFYLTTLFQNNLMLWVRLAGLSPLSYIFL